MQKPLGQYTEAQAAWKQGEDPLADAAADLELREAMAAGFDEMRY